MGSERRTGARCMGRHHGARRDARHTVRRRAARLGRRRGRELAWLRLCCVTVSSSRRRRRRRKRSTRDAGHNFGRDLRNMRCDRPLHTLSSNGTSDDGGVARVDPPLAPHVTCDFIQHFTCSYPTPRVCRPPPPPVRPSTARTRGGTARPQTENLVMRIAKRLVGAASEYDGSRFVTNDPAERPARRDAVAALPRLNRGLCGRHPPLLCSAFRLR